MTHEQMKARRDEIVGLWRIGVGVKELAYQYQLAERSIQRIVANAMKRGNHDSKTSGAMARNQAG